MFPGARLDREDARTCAFPLVAARRREQARGVGSGCGVVDRTEGGIDAAGGVMVGLLDLLPRPPEHPGMLLVIGLAAALVLIVVLRRRRRRAEGEDSAP